MDTPATGVQDGKTGDTKDDGAQPKGEQFFVGTYKSKEDAERGLQEKESAVRTYQSQVDKLKAENAKLQADTLAKMAEVLAATHKPAGPSQADLQAEIDALAGEMDTNGGKGILKVMGRYQQDLEQRLTNKFQQQIEETRAREKADLDELKRSFRENDPQYQARKPMIDQIKKEFGIESDDVAMKVAAKMFPDAKFPQPGGTQAGSSGVPKEKDEEFDTGFTKQLDGDFKPMSAEEKATLAKIMAAKKRGRK